MIIMLTILLYRDEDHDQEIPLGESVFVSNPFIRSPDKGSSQRKKGQKKIGVLCANKHAIIQSLFKSENTITKQNKITSRRTLLTNYVLCEPELV